MFKIAKFNVDKIGVIPRMLLARVSTRNYSGAIPSPKMFFVLGEG
jgi:hypothetical protein